jgi:hypothetical protein
MLQRPVIKLIAKAARQQSSIQDRALPSDKTHAFQDALLKLKR